MTTNTDSTNDKTVRKDTETLTSGDPAYDKVFKEDITKTTTNTDPGYDKILRRDTETTNVDPAYDKMFREDTKMTTGADPAYDKILRKDTETTSADPAYDKKDMIISNAESIDMSSNLAYGATSDHYTN